MRITTKFYTLSKYENIELITENIPRYNDYLISQRNKQNKSKCKITK
jgi:hypothetical protein